MKMQGSFCSPMSLRAQHFSRPKSVLLRGVYSKRLVSPLSIDISRWIRNVSRSFESVHPKLTTSGSASTWQRKLDGWSRDTTTVNGLERRQTGASTCRQQPFGCSRRRRNNDGDDKTIENKNVRTRWHSTLSSCRLVTTRKTTTSGKN